MKRLLIYLALLLAPFLATGQQKISGRVLSATDLKPLSGAFINLKGTVGGVIADSSGRFTFNLKNLEGTLVFSFLGFETTELSAMALRKDTAVVMKPLLATLSEVVVSTGYQQFPRERSTGSFTHISNEKFNGQVSTDVLSRLEALASGLMVDRSTTPTGRLMVRGLSTIRGPKEPLIVIDNFPYDGDLANINPNDVENITILKDAAAASIWGTRAGNGVIIISTKKALFNRPITFEFNNNVSAGARPDLSAIANISSSDFIDVEQELFGRGYYQNQINDVSRPALTPVVELLARKAAGTISAAEADLQIASLRRVDVMDEFKRHIYQNSVNQQYSLNARGGTANAAWLIAGGYDKNISDLAADFNRVNLRFQSTLKPLKKLQVISSLYYTQNNNSSGRPGYGSITSMPGSIYPYARFADQEGRSLPVIKDYRQSYLETAGQGKLLNWQYYPLEDYKYSRSTRNIQDFIGNLDMEYTLFNGLKAGIKYQYERQAAQGRTLMEEESYLSRNLINLYTRIDPVSGAVDYAVPRGGILDASHSTLQSHNLRGQLQYDRRWKKHQLSALTGGEVRNSTPESNSFRAYGYNDELGTSVNVDLVNPYPTFITGSSGFIPNGTGFSGNTNRFLSSYLNAAYTFNDRYTLSVSGRTDASNLFGVNINDKWNPLWSVGAGWLVSHESFYKSSLLPYLKLRATYGYSGNADPSMTGVTTIRYSLTSPYTLNTYALVSRFANPELRWERVRMANAGLDFSSANNRVSGSLEFFTKRATDLFGASPIDQTAGVGTSIIKNVASMKGHGIDIQLNSINLRGAVKWESNLNFSYYKDRVTDYYLSSTQGRNFVGSSSQANISGLVGKPVYSIFSYKWAGLDGITGSPVGYLNGQKSTDYTAITGSATTINDLIYHGSALPVYFGSAGNTFKWKAFSINAGITWKLGYYFRRESISYWSLFGGGGHADFAQRWKIPGDEQRTYVPSMIYPNNINRDSFYSGSEVLVEPGDHIRLQYITAGYELNKQQWKKLPLNGVQLYTTISNLGILWRANSLGLDPDYRSFDLLSPSRTIAFGLRGNF